VADLLRGDEIPACLHRVSLNRGAPFEFVAPPVPPEMERRRRDADAHRLSTLAEIERLHPEHVIPDSPEETSKFLQSGAELIVRPRLHHDLVGRRRATVHVLVRVGRVDERYVYAPVLIKNNEILELASTRRILEGGLSHLLPNEATYTDGVGPRSTHTVTRNGLNLAHATRVLGALGHDDPLGRVAIIDRHRRLLWFDLASTNYPRFNLATYDTLYAQRLEVLKAHDQWSQYGGDFPTSPYWHRECLECPYSSHCEEQLEAIDDVSLARFTSLEQQVVLHEQGVDTREQLARLDPARARQARSRVFVAHAEIEREDFLGRSVDKLDELIYRARAHERGTSLRTVDAASVGCPTADVEVDIDMESYGDTTYLWGALVSINQPTEGVTPGYRAFVDWGAPTVDSEARIFSEFWSWFSDVRRGCAEQGRSVAAYCFWAQAEDGAMERAVATPLADGPTVSDLVEFRTSSPSQWIDLHECAKQQIQTEGPLGLKQLAAAVGFRWRDANPSGEASMLWFEMASDLDLDTSATYRQRILEYNEDDCRATRALRLWLNGPARELPHRDDPF
jgi:predicted RecB family nuclease